MTLCTILKKKKKEGLIVLADFEKAFDSVEWGYLDKVLTAYNFGENFRSWFKTLYNDSESCVINCGHFSEFFKLQRGCRQGDPLSPFLFLLAIEPLAMAMKNNTEIQEIKIGEEHYKIGQYADDTFLLLKGDEKSLRCAIQTFQKFHQCSGLKLNMEKTIVAWLGAKKLSKDQIGTDLNLQWTSSFKLLGIHFNTQDIKSIHNLNLTSKLEEISSTLIQYKRRNLSIIGKVTVVKTLVLPKMIHILSVLPSPEDAFINRLNEMISQFIWNTKRGKVDRNLLAQNYEVGGLKLTHLRSQIDALKIRWVKYLILENSEWTNILQTVSGIDDCESLLSLDPKSINVIANRISNPFWKEVLTAWAKLVKSYFVEETQTQKILNFTLKGAWYIQNPNLEHLLAPLKDLGCERIGDLYNRDMKLIEYEEFQRKFLDLNFLDYASLVSSIPKNWKRQMARLPQKPDLIEPDLQYKIITQDKTCKFAYQVFINDLQVRKTYEQKWQNSILDITEDCWNIFNSLAFKCTQNTKLQAFQYKLIHRILGVRKLLKYCNITQDDTCIWCNEDPETLMHLFISCPVARSFWNDIKDWLEPYLDVSLNSKEIIFGKPNDDTFNHIVLAVKYYMFQCSYIQVSPNIVGAKNSIKLEMTVEEQIAKRSVKAGNVFQRKWGLLRGAFEA